MRIAFLTIVFFTRASDNSSLFMNKQTDYLEAESFIEWHLAANGGSKVGTLRAISTSKEKK